MAYIVDSILYVELLTSALQFTVGNVGNASSLQFGGSNLFYINSSGLVCSSVSLNGVQVDAILNYGVEITSVYTNYQYFYNILWLNVKSQMHTHSIAVVNYAAN